MAVESEPSRSVTPKRVAVFLVTAVATYFALVFVLLIAGGGAVSCTSDCSGLQGWLNDAYPAPMIVGVGIAVAAGIQVAGRIR